MPEKIEMRPDPKREEVYRHYYNLYKAALEASKPIFKEF